MHADHGYRLCYSRDLPVQTGSRFSRNARPPSCASSVAICPQHNLPDAVSPKFSVHFTPKFRHLVLSVVAPRSRTTRENGGKMAQNGRETANKQWVVGQVALGYRVGAAHRLAEAHRLLSARFLLALLEECSSGAGKDRAVYDPAHLAHHRAPADLLDHTLRDRRCPNAPHSSEQHSHAVSAAAVDVSSISVSSERPLRSEPAVRPAAAESGHACQHQRDRR